MSEAGFDRIIGQEPARRVLRRAIASGNPSHAYSFVGLRGTGKLTVSIEFAKALNCLSRVGSDACGECAMCRALMHGNDPDVRVWSPDKMNTTSIDLMRQMRDFSAIRPMRAKWKVNVVEQGDTLNEESANCILKLLEEPPPFVINILLFRNQARMLPTIRSRCQFVRFTQVPAETLAAALVTDFGVEPTRADFLATYTQGRPGAAIELIDDANFAEERDSVISIAGNAGTGEPWAALRLAEMLRTRADVKEDAEPQIDDSDDSEPARGASAGPKPSREALVDTLDALMVWYRDILAVMVQGNDARLVNSDRRPDLTRQAVAYADAGRVGGIVEAILSTKRAVLGNANPQIQTEALMLRITDAGRG